MKSRKITQEKADAINRKRDMIEGTDLSWEHETNRVIVDDRGRGAIVDVRENRRYLP